MAVHRLSQKRLAVVLITVALIIAITVSLFFYMDFQKPYAGNVKAITVALLPNEAYSLSYVADAQQYFTANGLNVTFKSYTSGGTALAGVLNGEADIAEASEYVLVTQAVANASICTFGSLGKGSSIYIVGRTDKGINNISDLDGKRIGDALGTATEFYLGRFLELNGMHESQVTLVNVPVGQSPNALENGTVDAVITIQPYISMIQSQLGNKTVTWSAQADQPYYIDAICTNSWAAAHQDLILRFLKSVTQAESYVTIHQDQAMAIVANRLNYTSSYLASVWSDFQFTVSLDQSQVLAMQDEARWLISNKLTMATTVPNFSNFIYVDGLKTVKPASVNIIP